MFTHSLVQSRIAALILALSCLFSNQVRAESTMPESPLAPADWLDLREDFADFPVENAALASSMEVRTVFVARARRLAREILAAAYHSDQASANAKEIYSALWRRLETIRIEFTEPGRDFTHCIENRNTWAFHQNGVAYLCDLLLRPANRAVDLVGPIIHETAHAIYGSDECTASLYEISAMVHAGFRSRGNGYLSDGTCPNLTTRSTIR